MMIHIVASMEKWLLEALYYAYPVSLSSALLISHLLLFRREKDLLRVEQSRASLSLIWCLQVCLTLSLVRALIIHEATLE